MKRISVLHLFTLLFVVPVVLFVFSLSYRISIIAEMQSRLRRRRKGQLHENDLTLTFEQHILCISSHIGRHICLVNF